MQPEKREVAVFINMPAAERAGQAAIQGTNDRYRVVRKYRREAVIGYCVRLKSIDDPAPEQPARYIME